MNVIPGHLTKNLQQVRKRSIFFSDNCIYETLNVTSLKTLLWDPEKKKSTHNFCLAISITISIQQWDMIHYIKAIERNETLRYSKKQNPH